MGVLFPLLGHAQVVVGLFFFVSRPTVVFLRRSSGIIQVGWSVVVCVSCHVWLARVRFPLQQSVRNSHLPSHHQIYRYEEEMRTNNMFCMCSDFFEQLTECTQQHCLRALTSFLACVCCFFFLQPIHRQTCTLMDRTGLESIVFAKQEQFTLSS